MAKKIKVTQIRDGKRVTFLTPDKGKPGKTPKEEQWYEPSGVESGWKKDMPEGERRRLVLKTHKGDELSSARSMQAKVNVTTDRETKQKARADARYFFKRHRIGKGTVTPKPKVERGKAKLAITEVLKKRREITGKHWEESKKEQLQRIANMVDGVAQKHNVPKSVLLKSLAITPTYSELRSKHTSRSSLAQASDERQAHQVTIEVDSPRVKVWLKDPSAADIKGIDTPRLGRKSPRITPLTPKLRR